MQAKAHRQSLDAIRRDEHGKNRYNVKHGWQNCRDAEQNSALCPQTAQSLEFAHRLYFRTGIVLNPLGG